ncbi:putative metalloprotease CJM1_0395 family protein [Glaciecola sp.]|jgi:hypothetical protein|uniref:putative metalloprotease CJM1_0395 family protein n=1 Tax=Glaciecola sp. MF2-115 TaxID=3384827 RepID=UPI0039897BCA
MNIVTPVPNSFGFPTNSVGTDSVRRDNIVREAIPSVTQGEKSGAEKGLAKEGERNNSAALLANLFQNPTYDRPSVDQALANNPSATDKDNANDESAGKENAESKQEQQQQQNEDKKVDELKERDREVRLHEQAHAATGGQYAGAPVYEYETGPDGKRYAVGGEVSIDIANEKTPTETIRKMQQVKAAALAPAEPSPQDYKVASEATQKEQKARGELAKEQGAEINNTSKQQSFEPSSTSNTQRTSETKTLEFDSVLSEQTKRTAAIVSDFYTDVSTLSRNSINFTV